MLQLYIDLSSSRLACREIQRIQRIQRIQLYSYTRYTAYSTIQPPSEYVLPLTSHTNNDRPVYQKSGGDYLYYWAASSD